MKGRFGNIAFLALLFALVLVLLTSVCGWGGDEAQKKVVINLSEDFLLFTKFLIWGGGLFLLALAALGVMFFGFDVRKARAELMQTTAEVKALAAEVRALAEDAKKDHAGFVAIKEEIIAMKMRFKNTVAEAEIRIEELGAQVEALADQAPSGRVRYAGPPDDLPPMDTVLPEPGEPEEDKQHLVERMNEILRTSSFKWTTMKRMVNKTGLSRDEILDLARNTPEIEIGMGKKTEDHIFKLKNGLA